MRWLDVDKNTMSHIFLYSKLNGRFVFEFWCITLVTHHFLLCSDHSPEVSYVLGEVHADIESVHQTRARPYSGHSRTGFQKSLAERLLAPIADVQVVGNQVNRRAANGQKRPLNSLESGKTSGHLRSQRCRALTCTTHRSDAMMLVLV